MQAQLSATVREVIAQPDMQKRLIDLGVDPKGCTPEEMAATFERDKRKWAQVIRDANIKI